jgi:hypothetical protein
MNYLRALILALVLAVPAGATLTEEEAAEAPPKGSCPDVTLTNGADTYVGASTCQEIYGFAGADRLHGDSGDAAASGDWVYGGAGRDVVSGGGGADLVAGGSGSDGLSGGPGTDVLGGDDGEADNFDCGPGSRDLVYRDTLAVEGYVRNCERHVVNGVSQ